MNLRDMTLSRDSRNPRIRRREACKLSRAQRSNESVCDGTAESNSEASRGLDAIDESMQTGYRGACGTNGQIVCGTGVVDGWMLIL
jgi:hypothetical protein